MKIIVSDTGPIVHLKEAGLLELLEEIGDIYIPKMVDVEITKLQPHWAKFQRLLTNLLIPLLK